jgi:hypothetical protein
MYRGKLIWIELGGCQSKCGKDVTDREEKVEERIQQGSGVKIREEQGGKLRQ